MMPDDKARSQKRFRSDGSKAISISASDSLLDFDEIAAISSQGRLDRGNSSNVSQAKLSSAKREILTDRK
jgi:hypothetical protein